jgi:hypothetical protein
MDLEKNKWLNAAIAYKLPMFWKDRHGLHLYCMTYLAENGGHKYRKVLTTHKISEALEISIYIYKAKGNLDIRTLTNETFWQYGWEPTMALVKDQLRETRLPHSNAMSVDWFGFWAWRHG